MPVVTCCVEFCAVGIPLIVSSFVMIAAFALHLCGAVAPAWFDFTYTSSGTSGYQGLWSHCTIVSNNICCGTVSNYYSTNGGVPDWLTASQYIVAISLCTGAASIVLVFVASCCASKTIAIPAVATTILTKMDMKLTNQNAEILRSVCLDFGITAQLFTQSLDEE
ncbi:uncharacterized protein LOC132550048 [Ylistrum balloti]|uniref:uncharacterized protein LOC132550048 n=1 Tax=Ylistrum balloti TaxID=509963 RepID=UPI002905E463|nr:uncharacterized protein LOC132550048 [Ylistrum balloti]